MSTKYGRVLVNLTPVASAFRARWPLGLRAMLYVGVPLVAGVAAGRPSWGAVASFGSFAGFYGGDAPRPHRIKMTAATGTLLAVVVPLGGLSASRAWLAAVFAGLVAAAASFTFVALRVPPPREYLVVLSALASTGIPVGLAGALRECVLVAAGALTAGLLTALPVWDRQRTPPLPQAWAAVADVLSTAGTSQAGKAREQALTAVSRAREALRQAGPRGEQLRALAAVQVVLASALSVSIEADSPVDPAWAGLVRVLGGRGTVDGAEPPPDLPGLRWALGQADLILRGESASQEMPDIHPPGIAERLRGAAGRDSVAVLTAVRLGIAVVAGMTLGRLLGLDHAYWTGLTAAAVLQANNVQFLTRRALHRVAGTIAGIGLAGAVFTVHPLAAVIVAVAVCAQFVSEVLVPVAYGLAVPFITVVALSIFDLAASGAGLGAAVEARLVDTLIGAVLAVVLRLLLWPRATAARMPQLQAETLRAAADAFRGRWVGDLAEQETTRHRLQGKLLSLRTAQQDMLADWLPGMARPADHVTPVIDELAVLALGIPFERPRPARPAAESLVRRLGQLADTVQSGTQAGGPDCPADLPGYPRLRTAVTTLGAVIGSRA